MFRLNVCPFAGALALSLAAGMASCVDHAYDLDRDIDMTISVGGEYLAIPAGSTDTAYLSKLIDEGDLLTVDGASHCYQLTKKDDVSVQPTSVKTVEIGQIESDGFTPVNIAGAGASAEADGSVSVDNEADFSTTVTGIDEALKELGTLSAETPGRLTVTFSFEGTYSYAEVRAAALSIVLPDFLTLREGAETRGTLSGNTLVLDGQLLSGGGNAPFTTVVEVTGYRFGDRAGQGIVPVAGTMDINGRMTVEGRVTTTAAAGSGGSLTFTPSAVLEPMSVNRVKGVIQPDIEVDPTDILLDDMPDFLKDDDTRLDITNPTIAFRATNTLDTPVQLNVALASLRNGESDPLAEVEVDALEIDAASTTVIVLSRLGQSSYPDGAHVKNVRVDDINSLWERIPDRIVVDMQAEVANPDYYEVDLGVEYDMQADYDVLVPLSFEKGLNIVYNDSICDLNGDLSDLDQVDFTTLNLNFTALNTIPLQLEVKPENVTLTDLAGRKIDDIVVASDGNRVAESTDGSTPVESSFTLTFTTAQPGVLSRIDRIAFKVTAVPGQALSIPLRDNQWFRMTKMSLGAPGGVKVDLN